MLLKVEALGPASLWISGSRIIDFKWPKGDDIDLIGPIKVCIAMQVWVGVFALSLFNGGNTSVTVCVLHSLWPAEMKTQFAGCLRSHTDTLPLKSGAHPFMSSGMYRFVYILSHYFPQGGSDMCSVGRFLVLSCALHSAREHNAVRGKKGNTCRSSCSCGTYLKYLNTALIIALFKDIMSRTSAHSNIYIEPLSLMCMLLFTKSSGTVFDTNILLMIIALYGKLGFNSTIMVYYSKEYYNSLVIRCAMSNANGRCVYLLLVLRTG